jgi:transposase InsO family protein
MARSFIIIKTKLLPDKYKEIKVLIKTIYQRHKGRYGYRRITDELQNKGIIINHKTVLRLMKTLGLKVLLESRNTDLLERAEKNSSNFREKF